MKHLFRLIAVTLGLPFLALPLFAQQNRVVDPNNPPIVTQGATNVPLSLDTYGRLLVNSGNPTGSAPYRIGQTNVTLSLDGRGRVLTNDVGGGGGGSGTVTSFSAGNLSPLFTTSVATATTTPALSFSLSSQSANRVFAGPTTGADAAPTFRALVAGDLPSGTVTAGSTLTSTALVTGAGSYGIQTPAATATLDSSGNISTPGGVSAGVGGSAAGYLNLGQGTAPSTGTTAVRIAAPTSVTSYVRILEGSAGSTGLYLGTVSGTTVTDSKVAIGTGVATALGVNVGSAGAFQVNNASGAGLTSLTAANISTGALANGMTATTQSPADKSTKLATTAYADTAARATHLGTFASPNTAAGSITWVSPVYDVYTSASGGTRTYTLPAASSYTGQACIIYVVAGTNHVNVQPASGAALVLAGTLLTANHYAQAATSAAGNYICFRSDGTNWVSLGYSGTWTDASSP